jgi:hypothetical protein
MSTQSERDNLLSKHQKTVQEWEALAFEWQEKLSDPCSEETLIEAAAYLQPRHYHEVLEERDANHLCGYPPCDRPPRPAGSKYKIDFKRKIVYDQSSLYLFCSQRCHAASKFFEAQLSTQPLHIRDRNQLPKVTLLPRQGPIRRTLLKQVALQTSTIEHYPIVAHLTQSNTTGKEAKVDVFESIQPKADGILKLKVQENPPKTSQSVRPPSPSKASTWNQVEGVKVKIDGKQQQEEDSDNDSDDLDLSVLRIH